MDTELGSVTHWIVVMKSKPDRHDLDKAATQLWDRYFDRLVRLSRTKLRSQPRVPAEGEDVASRVFLNIVEKLVTGRFTNLDNRGDLWRLLVKLTAGRVRDEVKREYRQKRGGVKVFDEAALNAGSPDETDALAQIIGNEPSPEFFALMAEEFRRLYALLDDDDDMQAITKMRMVGHTAEEIGETLGMGKRTVERKLGVVRTTWTAV